MAKTEILNEREQQGLEYMCKAQQQGRKRPGRLEGIWLSVKRREIVSGGWPDEANR